MERQIVGFHQDEEGHWVAELSCGHCQHLRHDPPWQVRPWVLSPESRQSHLGTVIECPLCGAGAELSDPYLDARLRGLCADGAAEVARGRRAKPDRQDS